MQEKYYWKIFKFIRACQEEEFNLNIRHKLIKQETN